MAARRSVSQLLSASACLKALKAQLLSTLASFTFAGSACLTHYSSLLWSSANHLQPRRKKGRRKLRQNCRQL